MRLSNPKHEAFCRERAAKKTATEAFILAGYSANDSNAARLNGNERIQARIAELQEKRAEKVEWKVEEAIATMREITDNRRSKGSDRVAAARAAASWLGWEKQTTPQSVPVILIHIGGAQPVNNSGEHNGHQD